MEEVGLDLADALKKCGRTEEGDGGNSSDDDHVALPPGGGEVSDEGDGSDTPPGSDDNLDEGLAVDEIEPEELADPHVEVACRVICGMVGGSGVPIPSWQSFNVRCNGHHATLNTCHYRGNLRTSGSTNISER